MAHFDEINVPLCKRRRWILFEKVIQNPEVAKVIKDYHRENTDGLTVSFGTFYGTITNHLPDGCDKAYLALLKNPDLTRQELVDLIEPPIKIISHAHKAIGLSNNPTEAYEQYMHKIGADELLYDAAPLHFEDTALYLRIDPFTKPGEIKDFIDKYYDSEMWKLLQTRPDWETEQSPYITKRNSKLRQTVGDNEEIIHKILALKAEGKKSPAIAEAIADEFDKHFDQAYIRRIISDRKQK